MPPRAVAAPAAAPAPAPAAAAPNAGKPPRPPRRSTTIKPPVEDPTPPAARKRRQSTIKPSSAEKATSAKTPAAKKAKLGATSSKSSPKSDSKQSKTIDKDRDAPPADPFKQIIIGSRLPPAPVITLARRDDVTQKFRKNFPLAPRKSRAKPRPPSAMVSTSLPNSTSPFSTLTSNPIVAVAGVPMVGVPTIGPAVATADGRVALRVIPGGQIPSRSNKRPNDSATADGGAAGVKKTKTRTTRPPSAADSSGVAAVAKERGAKISSEWHPGMHSVNGITLVEPIFNGVVPPPAPLVQEGTPPRYRPMRITASDLPEFDQEDGARGCLQFLRYVALCVGRITTTLPGRLQYTFNSEQRVYRERLTRVLLARDGRHADKVRAGGTRRSTRTRFAPDVFIPTTAEGRNSAYGFRREGESDYGEYEIGAGGVMIQPFDPVDLTDVRLGPTYQTELPQQRQRPAAPQEDESRWTENLVLEATGKKSRKAKVERPEKSPEEKHPACDDEQHVAAIGRQVSQLATTVGPAVAEAFGLGTMGTDTAKNLTEEQQEQLYEGIKKHGRNFFKISRDFVSGNIAPRVLAAYYYDVWKLSAIPAAKRWFSEKAAEEEQRIEEAKQQEILRAEDAARRAKSMEASNRRRQMKEAVQWVRNAAKNPFVASYNKVIVRERASRITSMHRMIAEDAIAGGSGGGGAAEAAADPAVVI